MPEAHVFENKWEKDLREHAAGAVKTVEAEAEKVVPAVEAAATEVAQSQVAAQAEGDLVKVAHAIEQEIADAEAKLKSLFGGAKSAS